MRRRMRRSPFGRHGSLGSFVAAGETESGVAEEARTRGFATPALAGCAFIERNGALVSYLRETGAVKLSRRPYLQFLAIRGPLP